MADEHATADQLRREAAALRSLADRLLKLAEQQERSEGVSRVAEIRAQVRLRLQRAGEID